MLRVIILLVCGCIGFGCLAVVGAEPAHPLPAPRRHTPQDAPPHLIVVRISPEVLRNRQRKEVERTTPVREVVLGTPAVGSADVQGEVTLDFFPDRNDAGLWLTFSGTTVSSTTSCRRPVIIHSVVTSQFTARKPITFDLDRGFRYGDATSDVRVLSTNRTVQSMVGGLRGRLVRRVAYRRLGRIDGYLQNIAERNTQQRIAESFDREADQRIAAINSAFHSLRLALQRQVDQSEEGRYGVTLNTTDRYLQIGIGPKGAANPQLPDEGIAQLPVQVWFHTSVFGEEAAPLVENWGTFQGVLPTPANFSGLATLLRLPRETGRPMGVEFATARPWVVIAAGREEERTAQRTEIDRSSF
jgi:hypothetical protein